MNDTAEIWVGKGSDRRKIVVPRAMRERAVELREKGSAFWFVTAEGTELDGLLAESGVSITYCENCSSNGTLGLEWLVAGPFDEPKERPKMKGGGASRRIVYRRGAVKVERKGDADWYNHEIAFWNCPICRAGKRLDQPRPIEL